MEQLDAPFFGNTLLSWLLAAGTLVVVFVLLRVVISTVGSQLAQLSGHTRNGWDDVVAAALTKTKHILLLIVAIYASATTLELPAEAHRVLRSGTVIALLLQAGIWASAGIRRWLAIHREGRPPEEAAAVMTMNVIGVAARFTLWSLIVLLSLDNMGVNVTALVAGLGVGGVAVALAAQSILADLFASLAIVLDRPFVLGDFLIVDDYLGAVEDIGLKTTRIRSLSGEQVIFSNTDLLGSRIRNYGRMFERRVVFKIGVTYQTPREKLERIPGIIRDAILAQGEDRVRFDRSHLQAYGEFAIQFETVFYVLAADYNLYMDIQQAIYLVVHERFEDEEIEFAYPTQTLLLRGVPADEPAMNSA